MSDKVPSTASVVAAIAGDLPDDANDEASSQVDAPKAARNTSVSKPPIDLVIVHPLVLLSVVDHYTRVARDTHKRVVGVLLGEVTKNKVDVTNSYAVPFEEDPKDSSAWYIDRQYHEDMFAMFKKINASEKVVGWYSTGPKLQPVDLAIHELFRAYTEHPALVIIDVKPKTSSKNEIPTQAYVSVETKPEETGRRQFIHVPSEIGAYEAEEVGVEHLLRNIKDNMESSLSDQVNAKLASLKGLKARLTEINAYVDRVLAGKLPANHAILNNIQDMFNTMPDMTAPALLKAFTVSTNDQMMVIYTASMIRSVLALHDLINNKLHNRRVEAEEKVKQQQRAAAAAATAAAAAADADADADADDDSASSSSSSSSSDKKKGA